MSSETYPNGLVATRRFDNAGNLFSLTYAKDGTTWMTFTQDVNALGQIVHQTRPQSAQTFGYDPADRLTTATNATGTSSYTESTEFGAPRDAATAYGTYGWLGSKERSTTSVD